MRELPGADAIRKAAEERAGLARELRRRLHQIPELAFEEAETTRLVENFFEARGIPFERSGAGTGGVALLGGGEGPCLILRADLDALPLDEATDLPFRSQHPGRMHACGHDAHVAMLLCAADALASGAVPFASERARILFLFQPAEEGPGGCLRLLEGGLLTRHPARAAVALHVWPELRTGTVGVAAGPLMASMDRVEVIFRGRGGHGAYPHACVDPVVMAAEAILGFQTLVSRRIDPLEPGLFTVGAVHGGTAPNIIPDTVALLGTVRAYDEGVRRALIAGIERIAGGVASAHGGAYELKVDEGYPVTRNDPEVATALAEALTEVLGAAAVCEGRRTMGSEDMGYLLERVPGCYLQLGASSRPETAEPLHSPRFAIDEACLPVGVACLLTATAALGVAER